MCGRSGDEKGVEAAEGDKKEATEKGSKKDFARRQQKRKGPPDLFLSLSRSAPRAPTPRRQTFPRPPPCMDRPRRDPRAPARRGQTLHRLPPEKPWH